MADLLHVEVVSADRTVWSGDAQMVVARTVEGDIGILPRHEPIMAVLVPGAAVITGSDGARQVIAVDGGFISVAQNQVSILSQFAQLGEEVDLDKAKADFTEAQELIAGGDDSLATKERLDRARGQLKIADRS
ncbi:F0F1 ATP synthase subunit epsilon [Parenemella sanctibonifatiensis]|uniref:ATP synthase epsilon chain n=1 Tax=Parenemella sanctibonifatiensis TaxID=2016505 RepID=A0A255EHD7_9ACTN|nr:F0F1 ATP synthase subunit epsilon [Parenemella sanctibonifatiensis]OYN90958.1 ATP synthase F1 subunit epsilon [Parenemella sanctibonifatiensis]